MGLSHSLMKCKCKWGVIRAGPLQVFSRLEILRKIRAVECSVVKPSLSFWASRVELKSPNRQRGTDGKVARTENICSIRDMEKGGGTYTFTNNIS
ncbi:hypothetical protein XELAEV_18001708mg [Xenopus laevis]|nr:hypothetical protein XELAEV_18001708mg [Xenopus laevis]